MRNYSLLDKLLVCADKTLQLVHGPQKTIRPNPATRLEENPLDEEQQRHAAGLMRINHVGEICAQALYQGQALTARTARITTKLQQAAEEEIDHLVWCEQRLKELNARLSYLNPFWYSSALIIGIMAGIVGDEISLGFLAETEKQVARHLASHLACLPPNDHKSRAIITQMHSEEMTHAHTAEELGACSLPPLVQVTMCYLAKMMTLIAYRI